MEIYTKISEEKYPKVSVTTIGKLQENTRALCKMAVKFSQQKADFVAVQKSSFSLEWSACNCYNSFVSTPNCAPFEALDSWLPELWNGIYHVENGLREVLQKCERRLQLLHFDFSSLCFSLVFSFAWLVLTIQKAVKTLKLATNMIKRHC